MSLRELTYKAIRQRKYLIRSGKSMKNVMKCQKAIHKFENYLKAYPNATDQALRKVITRHRELFKALIPGKGSASHKSYTDQLNQLL